jgi:hypothetical protein
MTGDVGSRQNRDPPILGQKDVEQGGEAHGAHRVQLATRKSCKFFSREPRSTRGSAIRKEQIIFFFAVQFCILGLPFGAFQSVLNRIIPNMTGDVELNLLDGQNVGPPIHGTQRVKQGGEAHGAHRVQI